MKNKTKQSNISQFFISPSRGDSPFKRMVIHLTLIIACAIAVYPVLRIISVSLRPGDRLLSTSLAIIPKDASFYSYYRIIFEKPFILWLWNSLAITTTTALIGLILASTSAYAFSRWNFPGRKPGLFFLLTTQMIPAAMLVVPIYILAVKFQLINSYRGLALAYSVRMGTFFRIILPLSTPALAIVFLFNFMMAWNDWIMARIMLQRENMFTWPLGIWTLAGQFRVEWGAFTAASILVAVPVMALFLYSSKWLISGLTLGSVKG